jgi:hypothetical protein
LSANERVTNFVIGQNGWLQRNAEGAKTFTRISISRGWRELRHWSEWQFKSFPKDGLKKAIGG